MKDLKVLQADFGSTVLQAKPYIIGCLSIRNYKCALKGSLK